MKRSGVAIIVLTTALLVSNIYWFVRMLEFGVQNTLIQANYQAQTIALNEALAILPVAADPTSLKAGVIRAGAAVHLKYRPAAEGDFVRLYGIRLKFNEQGRLIEAKDNFMSGNEFLPKGPIQ